MGFIGTDAQMVKLHLRLGPGQRQRAFKGACVAIFVRQIQHLLARGGDNGRKNRLALWCPAECVPCAASSSPGRARSRPCSRAAAIDDRDGIARLGPRPMKSRAIRFILQVADRFALHHSTCASPNGRFSIRLLAARGDQRADIGNEFGLDK